MTILPPPRLWLQQARADLRVAKSTAPEQLECHARYWLQQAYEKSLKGYLVASLQPNEPKQVEEILRDTILRAHSPLAEYRPGQPLNELEDKLKNQYPAHWQRGITILKMLRRQAHWLLTQHPAFAILIQVDSTRPSIRSDAVSYRYPFFDSKTSWSPAKWSGWQDYQGPREEVTQALEAFLDHVGLTIGTSGRRNC